MSKDVPDIYWIAKAKLDLDLALQFLYARSNEETFIHINRAQESLRKLEEAKQWQVM